MSIIDIICRHLLQTGVVDGQQNDVAKEVRYLCGREWIVVVGSTVDDQNENESHRRSRRSPLLGKVASVGNGGDVKLVGIDVLGSKDSADEKKPLEELITPKQNSNGTV